MEWEKRMIDQEGILKKETENIYKFRRQFVLGPEYLSYLHGWERTKIDDNNYITSHPDLDKASVQIEGTSLFLLGFILDPFNPKKKNTDILNDLMQCKDSTDLFEETGKYGGRWILIYKTDKEFIMFNDMAGLRQIFHMKDIKGEIWCCSEPEILKDHLDLQQDSEAIEFMKSDAFNKMAEHWWPGNRGLYKDVYHLTPNHYLDLNTYKEIRYWPYKKLAKQNLKNVVQKSSELLKGLIVSASERYKLSLPLTAGWDSRALLSATKGINKNIHYYTLLYRNLDRNHQDVHIPEKLISKFNLEHQAIQCPPKMDDLFEDIYMSNTSCAHMEWGAIAQGMHYDYPQDRMCIKGNVSEIARDTYRIEDKEIPNEKVNAKMLARLMEMSNNEYALRRFDEWLDSARKPCDENNFKLIDLFYWEQRMGNWQAMSQLEWDIVQETFTPYNCRLLMETMLGVNIKFRVIPSNIMYREIIKFLWEELLEIPINPDSTKLSSKEKLKSFIKKKFPFIYIYHLRK
ncbi:hypothetical protein [Bacillus wiedmannii]|uniref:hypothetical protein n=1 Tax=Bacillus wiedmannii TaxID=1890302 RepID=UPI0034D57B42